jgi:hypothetical protein
MCQCRRTPRTTVKRGDLTQSSQRFGAEGHREEETEAQRMPRQERSGAFRSWTRGSGHVVLVQSLADQGFDDGLPADVQFLRGALQFFEHGGSEIDIHALEGFIRRPELVKKRETSLPLSAMRAMDSADAGFFLGDMLPLG